METHTSWLLLIRGAALCVPLSYLAAAVLERRAARAASTAGAWAMAWAVVFALATYVAPAEVAAAASDYVRSDAVSHTMLLLVTGLGLAIIRYSNTYLDGEAGRASYARWLMATLAAVTTLAVANHLIVMAAAWTATGLCLHKLLTFYADRTAARVAAHKKFIVSRCADACLWIAAALVYRDVGSFNLDVLSASVDERAALTPGLQCAAYLFVAAACLKSAQLPFHGWLIQVMEAPTPVSALLHAGVVNLGGLLMIRVSPLMSYAPGAQLTLVVVGTVTLVIASLVATTRVSVKVALAWSTCAQMGMLLVECGLGAWHLALLHIVAHSLYKAHAFLSAGTTVDGWRQQSLAAPQRVSVGRTLIAPATLLSVIGLAWFVSPSVRALFSLNQPLAPALIVMVALSLLPLLTPAQSKVPVRIASALAVTLLYLAWHVSAAWLWPTLAQGTPDLRGVLVLAAGVLALFSVRAVLVLWPVGPLASTLHRVLFAGLYLDELFTRLTFRLWPPRLPQVTSPVPANLNALVENPS